MVWHDYITGPVQKVYRNAVDAVTSPPRQFWGLLGLTVATGCFGYYMTRRWVEAQPNEWLLVIRNGRLVKAGVGLKTFPGLLDTIVTFPSKV